jgi:hypothetical protein
VRPAARLALAALFTAAIGGSGLACPARALDVNITANGVNTLVFGCESFRDACATLKACRHNVLLCDQSTCELRQECALPNGAEWTPWQTMGMRMLLLAPSGSDLNLKTRTACVPLNLKPCILDKAGLIGCPDAPADAGACAEDVFREAAQAALGSGLTFDGFSSPDDALLVAALYRKPGMESSCDPSVLVAPDDCATENLVAVAGLAAPLGGGTYDITCASCQGGPRTSLGPNTGACPVSANACFLQRIAALLDQ